MNNKLHPQAIFIQLLTHCNAECINCPFEFTYNSIHPKGRMSDETWNKILSDIIEMEFEGQVGFYLHHEPLIDISLFDKIKDINEKTKAHVVLSTNGQLLTESNIIKMIDANPKRVHLNINSGNKEEYESSMKGLKYETTINNCKNFIEKAKNIIDIEVNCPVIEGFDVDSLKQIFPDVNVNLEYWANSRGGLLPDFYQENKGSRFKVDNFCQQPTQNFNILYDGSTIACCMDWMHETKNEFLNVNNSSIIEVYNEISKLEEVFKEGNYSKYKMCNTCSKEMGFYRKEDQKLKILLANHHLTSYTGSETLTLTLAKYLLNQGHRITIYSKYISEFHLTEIESEIRLVNNLEIIKNEKFDLAHIHHNISAYEVRHFFPSLPMIFYSQGILPFLEQPPDVDCNISRYLAISEEVEQNLIKYGVDKSKITIIRNFVDEVKFTSIIKPNESPKKALVISRKLDQEKEQIIKNACNTTNILVEFIGGRFGEMDQLELKMKIEESDIIFSLGRGAIESMMLGKAVIIFDYLGGDGMVTSTNYEEIRKNNFSGRRFKFPLSSKDLIKEIQKYNPLEINEIKHRVIKDYSAFKTVKLLESIYYEEIENSDLDDQVNSTTKSIPNYYNIIRETKEAAEAFFYSKGVNVANSQYLHELIEIGESLIKEDNTALAKQILEIALSKDKENLNVLNNLAVIEIMDGQTDLALNRIRKILSKNPEDEIALNNLNYLITVIENNNKCYPTTKKIMEKIKND